MSDLHLSPTLKRILLEAVILCTFAMAVGLSLNYRMVMNAFTGKTVAPVARSTPPAASGDTQESQPRLLFPEPVELEDIDALVADGALLVDARNATEYRESHLSGAVSLPLGEVEQRLDGFVAKVPKDRILITYCNGFGCPDSFDLGMRLLEEGYTDVRVFEGGYPQWRDAGRPLTEGAE